MLKLFEKGVCRIIPAIYAAGNFLISVDPGAAGADKKGL
jgi:hypothetical protein